MAGRPPWKPNKRELDQVETMAGLGFTEDDIGLVMQKDPKTIRKHCTHQLAVGHIKANMTVSANLFKIATGPGREAVTAAIWWEKTRRGMSEFKAVPDQPKKPTGYQSKKQAAIDEAATAAEESPGWGGLVKH